MTTNDIHAPHTPPAPAVAAVPRSRPARWPLLLLAAPAFVAVWSGWVGLGRLTAFGPVEPLPGIADGWTIDTAITLPIGVETYAAYALRVWLSDTVPVRARRFARWSALGSLLLGAAGQVAYHLMVAAGMTTAPWQITAAVACLPVLVLGMGAALVHLVREGDPTEPATGDAQDHSAATAAVRDDDQAQLDVDPRRQDHDEHDHDHEDQDDEDQDDDQGDEEEVPGPVPAPRPAAPLSVAAARPSDGARQRAGAGRAAPRAGAGTAARVARLRERHPDMPAAEIARRLKVTDRTVRRYLGAGDPPGTATSTGSTTSTDGPADEAGAA